MLGKDMPIVREFTEDMTHACFDARRVVFFHAQGAGNFIRR